jgi:hypothetical protein
MQSRLVTGFDDLKRCLLAGEVTPDVWSPLGAQSVSRMRKMGARIGFWSRKKDVLDFSSRTPENFEIAWNAGIDFWTTVSK